MNLPTLFGNLIRLFRFIISRHFIELGFRIEHAVLFVWFLWMELPKDLRTGTVAIFSFVTSASALQALFGALALSAIFVGIKLGRRIQARDRERAAEARATMKLRKAEVEMLKSLAEAVGVDRPKEKKPKRVRKIQADEAGAKSPSRPRKRAP